MNIYIGSPFFSNEQIQQVKDIEEAILKSGHDYYSPMRHSVLKDMTPKERANSARKVFDENIAEMDKADLILAMTDDFDPGTVFEIGYSFGTRKDIITYSPNNYGANVMLSQASCGHYTDLKVLANSLSSGKYTTIPMETTE